MIFDTPADVDQTVGAVLRELAGVDGFQSWLRFADKTYLVELSQPDCTFLLSFSRDRQPRVETDPTTAAADAVLRLTSDGAHAFLLGEANVVTAVRDGELAIVGAADEFFQLAPIVRAFVGPAYRELLEREGRSELARSPDRFWSSA